MKHVKNIGTVLYVVGFVLSISAMFIAQMMNSNSLHAIEHCLGVFIVGAVMVSVSELYGLWRGEE